jgi:hypothetical protein
VLAGRLKSSETSLTARREHASNFLDRLRQVGDVAQAVAGGHDVERRGWKRKGEHVADQEV